MTMTIEKMRRLWYLSTVPTHSPESLEELKELVREATIELVHTGEGICGACVRYNQENPFGCVRCSRRYEYFQLKMEGD
jgi:hypothetical protein